jgi:hypothetical protein
LPRNSSKKVNEMAALKEQGDYLNGVDSDAEEAAFVGVPASDKDRLKES